MPRPQQQQLDPGKATPTAEERPSPDTSEPMKIAWRYQSLPQVQLSFSSQFGHSYDLTVAMPTARIEAVKTFHFNALEKSARYVMHKGLFETRHFVLFRDVVLQKLVQCDLGPKRLSSIQRVFN